MSASFVTNPGVKPWEVQLAAPAAPSCQHPIEARDIKNEPLKEGGYEEIVSCKECGNVLERFARNRGW